MGFFDGDFFGAGAVALSDEERGRAALREFHNHSVNRYGDVYRYTFDELLREATKKNKFLLEGLGLAINSMEMSDEKVNRAMHELADAGKGRIPADWNGWFTAVKDSAMKVSFAEVVTYVASESAKDVVAGAQEIGDAVITTGKSLLTIMPLVLTLAAVFIVYNKAKSV